jgi:hypothetical protein
MHQITSYRAYFERHPPVHLLAAAYAGYKPPAKIETKPFTPLPDIEE